VYCPFCNQKDSRVLESRIADENSSIRRRRECENCKKRFTTYERVESIQLLVVKSSGAREPYSREKLRAGIVTACTKTTVSAQQIDELIESVELELQLFGKREIATSQLGGLVLTRLAALNDVAYVRFASVYRQFQSIQDFVQELQRISASESAVMKVQSPNPYIDAATVHHQK
jgi:transcriptional repressor NrdR